MESKTITVDGENVIIRKGTVFNLKVQIESGHGSLEPGTLLTVSDILEQPDGTHFELIPEDKPGNIETFMQYALETMLEDDELSKLEE